MSSFSCKLILRGACYLLRDNGEVCPEGSLVWSEEEKKTGGTEVGYGMAAQARGMCCKEAGEQKLPRTHSTFIFQLVFPVLKKNTPTNNCHQPECPREQCVQVSLQSLLHALAGVEGRSGRLSCAAAAMTTNFSRERD